MQRLRVGQAVEQRIDETEVRLLALLGVGGETGDQRVARLMPAFSCVWYGPGWLLLPVAM